MGLFDTVRDWLFPPTPPSPAPAAEVRRDGFENALSGLGTMYDKGANNGFVGGLRFTTETFSALYRDNGYAARLVDMVPDDATRKGWRVVDSTNDADLMQEENQRLQVVARFQTVHKWAREQGGAGLLIVTDDPSDDLSRPLGRVRKVASLVPLERDEMFAEAWVEDPLDPHFREVRMWRVSLVQAGGRSLSVHRSRILHFVGRRLRPRQMWENAGHGDSVLRAMAEELLGKTAADAAGRTLLHEVKVDVMKVRDLSALSTGAQEQYFESRMRLLNRSKSMLNLVLMHQGEEFETRTTSLAGWADLDDRAARALAAVAGVPQTLLYGDTPSGLNTDGEAGRTSWDRVIAAVQEFHFLPLLLQLYAVLLAQREGPTKGRPPKAWKVVFNPLDQPTEGEVAATRKTHAEVDALYLDRGVLAPEDVARSRFGPRGWQTDIVPVVDPEGDADPTAEAEALAEATGQAPERDLSALAPLMGVVEKVASGTLPRASAVELLVMLAGVSPEQAGRLLPPAPTEPVDDTPVPPEFDDATADDDGEE